MMQVSSVNSTGSGTRKRFSIKAGANVSSKIAEPLNATSHNPSINAVILITAIIVCRIWVGKTLIFGMDPTGHEPELHHFECLKVSLLKAE